MHRNIYQDLANLTKKSNNGISLDRLTQKFAKKALDRRELEASWEDEVDLNPYHMENLKRSLARAIDQETMDVDGNLPVAGVYEALQYVKAQKNVDKDAGLRALRGHLEKMWKGNRTASLNYKSYMELKDWYTRNYPKSHVAKVLDEIGQKGYSTLEVTKLAHIASQVQSQADFDDLMVAHGLAGRNPQQVKARNFIIALVNGEDPFEEEQPVDVADWVVKKMQWEVGGGDPEEFRSKFPPPKKAGRTSGMYDYLTPQDQVEADERYIADYDEDSMMYCVFDLTKDDHAVASFASTEEAESYANELNADHRHAKKLSDTFENWVRYSKKKAQYEDYEEEREINGIKFYWDTRSDPSNPGWVWEIPGQGARAVGGYVGKDPEATDEELYAEYESDAFSGYSAHKKAQHENQSGFVITDNGTILVQISDPTASSGFYLADDDQTWDGGFGVAQNWEMISYDDPRITNEDHERLDWLLEESGVQSRGAHKKAQHMEPSVEYGEWALVEDSISSYWLPIEDAEEAEEKEEYFKIIEKVTGWGAYMTAPGYLDMSELAVFETEEEAWEYLKEYYMDDEDMDVEASKKAQAYEDELDPEDDWESLEPDEDDVFINPDGTVWFGQKNLGRFVEWDDIEEAIVQEAKASNYYPNVWSVSDHGNYNQTEINWDLVPKKKPSDWDF